MAAAAAAAATSDNTNQEIHDNCEGIHRPELLKELDDYIVERISFLAIEAFIVPCFCSKMPSNRAIYSFLNSF